MEGGQGNWLTVWGLPEPTKRPGSFYLCPFLCKEAPETHSLGLDPGSLLIGHGTMAKLLVCLGHDKTDVMKVI